MTRLVVIGASAGGIETLRALFRDLPANFPAPVCIVLHMAPESPDILPSILMNPDGLPVLHPRDGQPLRAGAAYVAPPDHHLLVEPGVLRLSRGPRENRFRPAIDPLFRSAAQSFGPASVGVVLSGNLDDGAAGLWTIKQMGGVAIVQDPADALFPSMPTHAARRVDVDYSVPLAEMAALLTRIVTSPLQGAEGVAVPDQLGVELRIAKNDHPGPLGVEVLADPSPYTCPECHGVLLQLKEGGHIRFRCHIGHAYTVDSLLADITEGIEEAMGVAVRALEEGGLFMAQMAAHFHASHGDGYGQRLATAIGQARRHADAIRSLLREREWQSD